jgi:thymidylate synthase (FAD)
MMDVELIDYMGSDLTVVNAARVSFNKQSKELSMGDEGLIKFLAEHNHWTPFGHCTLQFRIKAPIFVARQLVKHQIGLTWNEVSRRYVQSEPELYSPESWRANPENKKQGSSETETVDWLLVNEKSVTDAVESLSSKAIALYNELIDAGVCAEQARMVLPQSLMTEWYWTGSLYAFAYFAKQQFPISWKNLVGVEAHVRSAA